MRYFANCFIVAGVVLMSATAAFPAAPATPAPPAATGMKGSPGNAKPADKATPAPAVAEKPVVKKEAAKVTHKHRKAARHASMAKVRTADAAPGERLTISQVMELLKTNRNFAGRNLSGLRLAGFDLTKCNLKGADLSNASLERADLEESNLELADLSGANLKMADLRITGIKGAKLDSAILDGAIWLDGTICAKGSTGVCREHPSQFALIQN